MTADKLSTFDVLIEIQEEVEINTNDFEIKKNAF
jgi:hypothetical protein